MLRLQAELDELGRVYLERVRADVRLRVILQAYHAEVCGCEGDACDLGELLNDVPRALETNVEQLATPLEAKLSAFDEEAELASHALFGRMSAERRAHLIALARVRHIEGHGLYGDRQLFEWSDDRLEQERDEELADSIIYTVVLRRRHAAEARPAA